MTLAYGVVGFDYRAIRNAKSFAVWAYDLDRPRRQSPGLPQGSVVELVGVYSTLRKALDVIAGRKGRAS